MKELQKASHQNIQSPPSNLSIKNLIDLALLSNKRIVFLISEQEYVELVGSFSFFLNNAAVLLCGNNNAQDASPKGFYSVYNRLMDKLSLSFSLDFKDVRVVLCVKNQKSLAFNKTVESVVINKHSSFSELTEALWRLDFKKVDLVRGVNEFCVKGGIVDLYSPLYQAPIRSYFYDDLTTFCFYNISTGLPLEDSLNSFAINKKSIKKESFPSSIFVQKYNFLQACVSKTKKPTKPPLILPVNEVEFVKTKKNTIFLQNLSFSAYLFKNTIYAPAIYQNINKTTTPYNEFIVGFDVGDYVCHEDFGIGKFMGLLGKGSEEYMKIKYQDGTINLSVKKLFKLSFVSRETNKGVDIGFLSKRGLWARKSSLVQKGAKEYVDKLVDIYSKKGSVPRPPYPFGGDLEKSFLAAFKYVETKDQKSVWLDLCRDLEGDFPMSRLLCGDVGFGKTELAMRAVFRVVVNGGRAVVLCPTSILVNQHFEVFGERLSSFGVCVSFLVGSLSVGEKNKIKSAWVDGKIDVLLATSSCLYDDVFVRFASLFVVDEEHRFGVKQKEELVNKFVNKDVLYMSATPIPRTLHLGLSGIQSISSLSTPPVLRKPINTVVSYFSEDLIKQGVNFEISRGGQVFFLHNRVSSILSVKSFLLRLCPASKIAVVHSRLGAAKIKEIVSDFINKKYNLLLCSSVIGSGIDIPAANTIFIDNAHLFGLSQLHQIRGRVGRGSLQGFAYLLIPKEGKLTESGKKRLQTIEQNNMLGSGYNLSRVDLEIRGGGVVFGYKQSGAVYDVGYEYYSKIVSKYFELQTQKKSITLIDSFNYRVPFVCCFKNSYIVSNYERLRAYREFSSLYSLSSIVSFKKKLASVYGVLGAEEKNLLNMRVASILGGRTGIVSLSLSGRVLELIFNNSFIGVDYLLKFLELYKTNFNIGSFVFGVVGENTKLSINLNTPQGVNGLFIKGFLEEFDGFCKT